MQTILSVWGYAINCLIVYVILGIGWYFIDRTFGVRIYRWCYDLCHKNPMPKEVVRGILYNQSSQRKIKIAVLVSTAQSVYMLYNYDVNLLAEIILWLLEVPAILIGFWVGYPLYRLFERRDKMFKTLDEIEAKASTLDGETARKKAIEGSEQMIVAGKGFVKSAVLSSGSFFTSFWRKHVFSVVREVPPEMEPMEPTTSEEIPKPDEGDVLKPEEPKQTPSQIIRAFKDGRRKS